jgi:hypothetical protein
MNYEEQLNYYIEYNNSNTIPHIPLVKTPTSNTLSKLGQQISLTKHVYALMGGQEGSGKTAFVDNTFILSPLYNMYMYEKPFKVKYIYRSMERSSHLKLAKWLCWLIYIDTGLVYDVPTVLSYPNAEKQLSREDLDLFKKYNTFLNILIGGTVDLKDGAENPTGVNKYLTNFARSNGVEYYSTMSNLYKNGKVIAKFNKDKDPLRITINGQSREVEIMSKFYIPNDEDLLVVHVTDHIGKIQKEQGFNDKQVLDKHSEYMGLARDTYGFCIIDITQLNRGIQDTIRGVKQELDIRSADFKGTSNVAENADLQLGLIEPQKHNKDTYDNYNVLRLDNKFRSLKVIKNSFGSANIRFGNLFYGEMGYYQDLPLGEKMTDTTYDKIINRELSSLKHSKLIDK